MSASEPTATSGTGPTGETRSARKARVILEAATTLFLRQGYLGTSMDEIAALAGVSKQTVYKHFADKEGLFFEIVRTTVDESSELIQDEAQRLSESDDVEAELRDLARRQIAAIMQPKLLQLRRLVIAEAERFPELGRAYYEHGATRSVESIAKAFEMLSARGLLNVRDPIMAASHFSWLIMAAPVNRVMLLGDDGLMSRGDLKEHVATGVQTFLAAYGP